MNFVFLMDPLSSVSFEKDTSFIFMLEAYRRGHRIYHLASGNIVIDKDQTFLHVTPAEPQNAKEKPFIEHKPVTLNADNIDAVFMRKDPPFDEQYLMDTWLVDQFPKKVFVFNSPLGLRTVNEKVWAIQFRSLTPPTFIGRTKQDLLNFVREENEVVTKPTNGFGGQAVIRIKAGDLNTNVILETLTNGWRREIILQKYLPKAQEGDKRILLLDGEPLGAVLRVHGNDDHRNNLFAGGQAKAAVIDKRDEEIIKILKPELKKLGLYFVGIDIIGGYLIEVNVTSPTCLQEMNRLYNKHLEQQVIDFVEKKVADLKKE